MRLLLTAVATVAGAALLVTACGDDTHTAACSTHRPPAPPRVVAGQLTASADRAVMPLGGSVVATVRATGPLSYTARCDSPLRLVVADSADIHVDSLAPAAPKGTPCASVSLAAGQHADYTVQWTADSTLPAGSYRLVLALGDQPPIALPVRLGVEVGC